MKRRVLVRHNGAAGCHKRTRRGTFGSRAERYQLKVCEMRITFQNSPNAPSYTFDRKEAAAPLIHGRAGKQAAALCVKHGEYDRC